MTFVEVTFSDADSGAACAFAAKSQSALTLDGEKGRKDAGRDTLKNDQLVVQIEVISNQFKSETL